MTPDQVNNLQAALNASPALVGQINDAVAQGHLRQIVPLTNANAGGEYDPENQAMRLPLAKLTTPPPGPNQSLNAQLNAADITFVMGHELQHGFNRAATKQALTTFAHDVQQIAQHDPTPRDYTAPAVALLAQNRRDEAGAEVAGWNATVDRVRNGHPSPTLKDIYDEQPGRMADFIDRTGSRPNFVYTLKPNLTLNPDQTLSATPANIEAMGQNYFDKASANARLGALGNSDYANYYGMNPVSFIAQVERAQHPPQPGVTAPQMTLNLSQLRMTEKLLEENGINLGPNQQPMPYFDSSSSPPTQRLFQHTATSHQHTLPVSAQTLDTEVARGGNAAASLRDQPFFVQALRGMDKLGPDAGGYRDQDGKERLAGALALKAGEYAPPIKEIQDVVTSKVNGNLFAVWTNPGNGMDVMRAHVDKTQALNQDLDGSLQKLQGITQEQARQLEFSQPARGQDEPGKSGPTR